ncbi:(-)-germacrene D synthase-like [Quercus lobata]|uniref:(-)-germacrene D synthase-like n=1 Tax=Quercus lobata TaxID=97700 RepID=UPI001243FC26|nr:(-)-germacrene D synthase-like [Quercus lobata]
MSTQVSGGSSQNGKSEVVRRTANFHPSIWGDRFIDNTSDDKDILLHKVREVEELKDEMRNEFFASTGHLSQQLGLIDALQRLGIAYHFEREIQEALEHIYTTFNDKNDVDDLYKVSLNFRLLRQEGFKVSCDVFNKFKDEDGQFKESLTSNVEGMLAFYEATHLRVHGEDILDEALEFTTTHLKSTASLIGNPLAAQITRALKQPLYKGIPRLEARRYISVYEQDASHNKVLLKISILDFNLVQSLHKEELSDITRWWKDLDFATKLPFARDRVVECYFWIVAVYFEPQYSLARKILTKVISMTSILDDIYDVYGTLEELEPFTEAIERWDISCIDQLPKYMQICYRALFDVFEAIENELAKKERSYRVSYAKDAMKRLVRAYFDEAKWFHQNYIPTMEEYMHVALKTSGYPMLTAISFLGMGDIVTKEAFDWIFSNPKMIKASSVIGRLMDDMKSHKFEQERGHAASAVECYMKQHGVSEQVVHDELNRQVANAWKDINEECIRPTIVPMPLLMRVLNLARVIDVIYKEGDGYTHVGKEMKDNVALVLIDPIPI